MEHVKVIYSYSQLNNILKTSTFIDLGHVALTLYRLLRKNETLYTKITFSKTVHIEWIYIENLFFYYWTYVVLC